jgi:glutathionyl-hydroquinone reductase
VNNESSEIIKMFNKDFDKFATKKFDDLFPENLQK